MVENKNPEKPAMQINEKDKPSILINLLNERYNASHHMRTRSQSFALWIFGLGVMSIWLLLNEVVLTIEQQIIITCFVGLVAVLTIYYIGAIQKGFYTNKKVMETIEQILGCYSEGVYLPSATLYPAEYKETCQKKGIIDWLCAHFTTLRIWIIVLCIVIICLIWIAPNQVKQTDKGNKLNRTTVEQTEIKQESDSAK